ncbi:NUDIX hydrolase [Azospirillum sp. ST 5-10]|uniref:NUDIX hydrolase n=1 Tax=unclassified Azospirillum TaxID=2630922 RepID=UPI003F4A1E23
MSALRDDPATASPADPRPAATLILLRDGADGLEVLTIERHAALSFAAGATVFPGGCLDPADHDPAWADLPPAVDRARRIAAVRETWEECGILLARERATGAPVEPARTARIDPALPFAEAMRREALVPDVDALVPFAHWQTPETLRRRFDTVFFLAAAPTGQDARVDGAEAVAWRWDTPRRLVGADDAGDLRLVFATRMNLLRLAACATVAAAVAAARRAPPVLVLPRLVETAAGPVFRIPEHAGYRPVETPADRVRLG